MLWRVQFGKYKSKLADRYNTTKEDIWYFYVFIIDLFLLVFIFLKKKISQKFQVILEERQKKNLDKTEMTGKTHHGMHPV